MGVSEVFKDNKFMCHKQDLSLNNETELAPEILGNDGSYNAMKADIWSLGMILFECMTGKKLYDVSKNKENDPYLVMLPNGYYCLSDGCLKEYLKRNKFIKYFKTQSISLLNHLLDTNASARFEADDIIKHKWFSSYYKMYCSQIYRKSASQHQSLLKQCDKMDKFPFYGQN